MVDTMTSYRLIASDMARSLQRVSKEPMVERETAYYKENIGKVKSIDDFMADSRLYNYAMKAFGLEDMAFAKAFVRSNADVDKQAKMIEDKIDFTKMSDPDYVSKLISRFTAMYEMNNPTASSPASIASLLLGGTSSVGISMDILSTLQNFKPGGR